MKKLFNKDFLLLLQGSGVSAIGDLLYSVAIGYWVYEKTGSSALMGMMSSVSMIVVMILSPFAGSIVDRCSRKGILVGMDVLRGILMLLVGLLAWKNVLTVAEVMGVAVLAAVCSVFFSPAVSTLMLDIIPRQEMVRGQSLYGGLNSFVNLVGKALSGMLVAFLGVPLIILLNGVSYLFSAVTELFIQVPATAKQGQPVTLKGILGDFSTALKEIGGNRFLKLFVPVALLANLFGAGAGALMLPFCLEKGLSVDQYGYLMAVETGASLLAVTLLGVVKLKADGRYWVLAVGFSGSVCFSLAYCFVGSFGLLSILVFGAAFLNALGNGVFNAVLMLALPEENRGTLLGLISTASVGGCALSAMLYGLLGEWMPMYLVFAVGGVLGAVPIFLLCAHKYTRIFIRENP